MRGDISRQVVGRHFGDHDCGLLDYGRWLGLTLLVEVVIDPARVSPNKRLGIFPSLRFVLPMRNQLRCGLWLGLTFLIEVVVNPARVAPTRQLGFFPGLGFVLLTGLEHLRNTILINITL